MQTDPAMEWRRLTEEYRAMGDVELLNLAADFDDLTENAKQALRQEMQSRGLDDPQAPIRSVSPTQRQSAAIHASRMERASSIIPEDSIFPANSIPGYLGDAPALVPDDSEHESVDATQPHDYTWKTPLCNCYSSKEAKQLQEVLKRAGIECWFNFGGYTNSFVPSTSLSVMFGDIQVLVAADQLEQARAIAARPIPQEIIDDSKAEVPEFVVPKCPKCGAEDPILEAVEPTNAWHCEQCDYEWSDPADSAVVNSPTTNDPPGA